MSNLDKLLLATLMIALTAIPSQAQEKENKPLRFSVWVSAKATDNRDSAPKGQEEDNMDLILAPRVDYVLGGGGRTTLDFFYTPSYRFRSDPAATQNENEWYHELGIDFSHQRTKRLSIKFYDLFTFDDDPSITDDSGNSIRQDGSFIMNRLTLGMDYKLSKRSIGRLSYHNRIKRFDNEIEANRSDEDVNTANLAYWYSIGNDTVLVMEGGIMDVSYETDLNIDRGFDSVSAALGVEHIKDNIRAGVRGGYRTVDYLDAELDKQDMPFAKIFGTYSTPGSMKINGAVIWDIRESDVFPFSAQEMTAFDASIEKTFNARFQLTVGMVLREGEYDQDSIPASTPQDAFVKAREGTEETMVGWGQLRYSLTPNQAVYLRHQYEDVESDVDTSFQRAETTLFWNMYF
jgi:hypothetical protein